MLEGCPEADVVIVGHVGLEELDHWVTSSGEGGPG
jgi:hypothetical protein